MSTTFTTLVDGKTLATMERVLNHSIHNVWNMLTDNSKLTQWFSELKVEDLRIDGTISFDMGDGTYEYMKILDVQAPYLLQYTWAEDNVRFQLSEVDGGSKLIFCEEISKVTEHTPRDIAGWHVCLDVIQAILDGEIIEDRTKIWSKWYEQYKAILQ
ncbi:SRPBCC family protein [Paenibacillus endoradicis]|uniref:SRPBCC family protein n=1 Tax=Paenibacillus endoradicis TaxID=2972487 RepID=UPI0021591EAD|nr:SRPBCC family protein [Paenibacillus endoradicis]MCR8656445.1 SRPBCC family protein [Paenibacillus endoradicis]